MVVVVVVVVGAAVVVVVVVLVVVVVVVVVVLLVVVVVVGELASIDVSEGAAVASIRDVVVSAGAVVELAAGASATVEVVIGVSPVAEHPTRSTIANRAVRLMTGLSAILPHYRRSIRAICIENHGEPRLPIHRITVLEISGKRVEVSMPTGGI